MTGRRVAIYYAWSRPGETGAPLAVIENRFPALFESRRMAYPRLAELSDASSFDQGIGGFLDHILKHNFVVFTALAGELTGQPVVAIERRTADGTLTPLDGGWLASVDTLIVISFDSQRTAQVASAGEVDALRHFLSEPDHLAFVCPHHDIGAVDDLPADMQQARQLIEFLHHGDRTIPPQQRFGGFARSLLAGLGVPVDNRFGLRPAAEPDGTPSPLAVERTLDRLDLLQGVTTLNLHPHLPQLDRLGDAVGKLEVLARQKIAPDAPPHPFAQAHTTFDAVLQSRPDAFAGTLLVCDATAWSSTAGGTDSLQRLWSNVVQRPRRDES